MTQSVWEIGQPFKILLVNGSKLDTEETAKVSNYFPVQEIHCLFIPVHFVYYDHIYYLIYEHNYQIKVDITYQCVI